MPNILLASDFDRTLAFDAVVPEYNIEAIKRFKDAGNKFAVVSGRSYGIIPRAAKEVCDYVVCCNGAYIVDSDEKIVYANPMRPIDVIESIKISREYGYNALIVHSAFSAIYENTHDLSDEFIEIFHDVFGEPASNIDEYINQDIYEISPNFSNMEVMEKVLNEIRMMSNVDENHNDCVIDVNNRNTSKSIGLNKLKQIAGFKKIYAIGDDLNDMPMIVDFESFAMKDGNKAIIDAADYTVESVAEAINYILQNNK